MSMNFKGTITARESVAGDSQSSGSAAHESSKTSLKRKRGNEAAEPVALSFPILTDVEPSLDVVRCILPSFSPASSSASSSFALPGLLDQSVQHNFQCVTKHLFALTDTSRDRGSAKIATITVSLHHPNFNTAAGAASRTTAVNSSRGYASYFKIDGRKSFSNAPFKKWYHRGIHTAWFAESTLASEPSSPAFGRVLMLLTQRGGRPNGKGFTGLRHDPHAHSPKHPLLCLASNSCDYIVSVFLNLTSEVLQCESMEEAPQDWRQVSVEVTARFDAGEVRMDQLPMREPTPIPTSHSSATASSATPLLSHTLPDAPPRLHAAASVDSSHASHSSNESHMMVTTSDDGSATDNEVSTPRCSHSPSEESEADHALLFHNAELSMDGSELFCLPDEDLDFLATVSSDLAVLMPAEAPKATLMHALGDMALMLPHTEVQSELYAVPILPMIRMRQPSEEEQHSKRARLSIHPSEQLNESLSFTSHIHADWHASSPQFLGGTSNLLPSCSPLLSDYPAFAF